MKLWKYMLRPDHSIERTTDLMKWANWFERACRDGSRRVARTELLDGSEVSTVFLGLDHDWFGKRPVLFETAYLIDPNTAPPAIHDGRAYQQIEIVDRYCTWAEAEVGHMEHVERLTGRLGLVKIEAKG